MIYYQQRINKYQVWIEPVRDWNVKLLIIFLNFIFMVWIEPVRDWNYLNCLNCVCNFWVWIEPVRDWNHTPQIWNSFIPSVNRTCEGLKLFIFFPTGLLTKSVWIEPVRDWNFDNLQVFIRNNKCESNLWGIETGEKPLLPYVKKFVWIEPVRDWNANLLLSITCWTTVWIEPVRDWNLKVCRRRRWNF